MRALTLLCVIAGCGGPAYRLAVTEAYEVGEDATVGVHVRKLSDDDAEVVITRPDGSVVKQRAPLDVEVSRIRFGPPLPRAGTEPTFNAEGTYRLELRAGKQVLARRTLEISLDHLNDLLSEESFSDYKPVVRYTRAKQSGNNRWKTYGAIYEHPFRTDARIEVVIEEPKQHLDEAWKSYKEGAPLSVMLNSNVRLRERTESVTVSWISTDLIVSMRAPTLRDLERGLIGHFLARFPSKLSAK